MYSAGPPREYGHEQPHEEQAKAASSDRPFFQVHLATGTCAETNDAGYKNNKKNNANGNSAGFHRG